MRQIYRLFFDLSHRSLMRCDVTLWPLSWRRSDGANCCYLTLLERCARTVPKISCALESLAPVGPLRPVYCKMRDDTCTQLRSFAEYDGSDRHIVANSKFFIKSAKSCEKMQKNAKNCEELRNVAKSCKELSKVAKSCKKVLKSRKIVKSCEKL